MCELIIMRHAKSSWTDDALDDFERPLNKRGRDAAQAMAKWMIGQQLRPDKTLCSDAKRTVETLEIMRANGLDTGNTELLHQLYLASPREIFSLLKDTESQFNRLMIIGHNPGLHIILQELVSNFDEDLELPFSANLPTAAVAHLSFNLNSWQSLMTHSAVLENYMAPKQLQSLAAD